jgi:hypothetical protein
VASYTRGAAAASTSAVMSFAASARPMPLVVSDCQVGKAPGIRDALNGFISMTASSTST